MRGVKVGRDVTPGHHTATLLANRKVLIVGGIGQLYPRAILVSAKLYDASTTRFADTGNTK